MLKVKIANDTIEFYGENINKLGMTDYTNELWEKIRNESWSVKPSNANPRYIYSNSSKKYLHRIVMEHYFGKLIVQEAYNSKMIIEHLDNNGFDCKISNLYFLLEIKNRHKGQYFDKLADKSIPVVALSIFHIFSKHTFQITIGFNQSFTNMESGSILSNVKFLYKTDYCIVLQDAENMLESIVREKKFVLEDFQKKYRFCDYKINFQEKIVLPQEEMGLHPGMLIWRDGVPMILLGQETVEENGKVKHYAGLIAKVKPEENW